MCCDLLSNPERDNIVAAPQRQTMAEQKPLVSKPQPIKQQQRPQQKVVYRQVQQKPVYRKQYRRNYDDDDEDDISFFQPIIAGALIYDGIMRNNPAEAMIGGFLV